MIPSPEQNLMETRLRRFFVAEVPTPWPAPPPVRKVEPHVTAPTGSRRTSFALAASLALFIGSVVLSAYADRGSQTGRWREPAPPPLGPPSAKLPAPVATPAPPPGPSPAPPVP